MKRRLPRISQLILSRIVAVQYLKLQLMTRVKLQRRIRHLSVATILHALTRWLSNTAGAVIRTTRLSFTPLASENDPKLRDTIHLANSLRSNDSTIRHRNRNRTNEKLFNINKSIQPRCRHRNSNQTYIGKCYHGPSRFAVQKIQKLVISCKSVIESVLLQNKRQIDMEYLRLNTKSSNVDQIASKRRYHERLRYAYGNSTLRECQSVEEPQNENAILKCNQCANQNIGISNKTTSQPKHVARKKPESKGRRVESKDKSTQQTEWDSSIVIYDLLNRKKSKTNASSNQVDDVLMSAVKTLSPTAGAQTAKPIESEDMLTRGSNSFSDIITSPATVKDIPSFGPSMTLIPKAIVGWQQNSTNRVPTEKMTNQRDCQQSYMSGIVLITDSDDFPYVVFTGNNLPLYLFPDSLLFGEELRQETKSMTNKMKERLITGDPITFKADCTGIVTTYIRDSRSSGAEVSNKGFTKVTTEAVFSPEIPPRCFAIKYGVVPYSVDPSKLVTNLVYNVKLAIMPYLGCANKDDELPRPSVTYEVVEVDQPIFRLDTLYEAPWITEDNRILSYNVDGEGISYRRIEWDIRRTIKNDIKGVVLENGIILCSKRPGFKVLVACKRDNKERHILRPGRRLCAKKLVYHSFLGCYIARDYLCYLEEEKMPEEKMPVPTKFIICGSETILVYQVDLKHSQWSDFYTAEQFGEYCLVDDPDLYLINAHEDREKFPAWVYQKDDDACVAKFSIAEVDDQSYSEKELANSFPDIHGVGLLVNNRTGSVFSKDHPMKRIKLMLSDRSSMEVGDYFRFVAKFHQYSFIIIKIDIIKHQRFTGKIIPWRDTFLFETKLTCGEFRGSRKAYPSLDLELVTDTEGIIATRASRKNRHEVVTAYVEENTDVNRSSFFNVYKMSLSEKEIELERPTTMSQARNWWQGNAPAKCRCRKSKELFAEIINVPHMRDLVTSVKSIHNLEQFL